ncbi:MAG: KEOPS complex subunit Cgi121 [Nitrososphaerota archaeon]
MITVKLLGGAKKSLSIDKMEIEKDDLTVAELIESFQKSIPKNMPPLDVKNMLVAINGVDSSALQGFATKLKSGDIVSIIPVIHGGSVRRMWFCIFKTRVELIKIKNNLNNATRFLEVLRLKYQDLAIQAIDARYVLNMEHAKKIITISLAAKKTNTMLSNKLETDILMRFACTKQISEAIQRAGLQKRQDFVLIVIGKKLPLDKLYTELSTILKLTQLSNSNPNFLKREFAISKKQLHSIFSHTKLEDLLAERAAVLFR